MAEPGDATVRFGERAGAYAQFRPGYADAVIDAVLSGFVSPVVADVGAGTGISSVALARHGARVIAIEPNEAMRAKIPVSAGIDVRAGTGHETGLDSKSVDVAACFQAFHWFADAAALDELSRVARRRVAIVQYERDETDAFARAYGSIVRAYATDDTEKRRSNALKFFEHWAGNPRQTFVKSQRLTLEELLGRVRSSSYLPHSGAAAGALDKDVAAVFERYESGGTVTFVSATYVVLRNLG